MTTLETDRRSSTIQYKESTTACRKVWDWPTRFFHWGLVVSFVGAFVTNKLGASYFSYHLWCGYAVIVLVTFRIIWGVVGTRHARFANFVEGPRGVLRYISATGRGRRTRYAGHNPLGAIMVLILLVTLAFQAAIGLFGDDEIFNVGPFAGLVSKPVSLTLTSLHRKLFYLILIAVGLHVGAVLAHVILKREPLIRAMFTGAKPVELVSADDAIKSSKSVLALLLLAAVSLALAFALRLAPSAEVDLAGF